MRDTIDMAREVGYPLMVFDGVPYVSPELERLVEFVRADERSVEREACAKMCDGLAKPETIWDIAKNCATAIRARGNT